MAINLNDLATFVRVAQLGTFTAAAKAEGVPKSTISRRVARLEARLNVELLRRSSRSFSLTADGRSLYARSLGALRELADATNALTDRAERPSGRLVITAPEDLGIVPAVVELFAEYAQRYPEVQLEVRLLDRLVDLVAEEIDVGLRIHPTESIPGDGSLMTRKIGVLQAGLYAAPSYLETHSPPQKPKDLANHISVIHSTFAKRPITLMRDDGSQELLTFAKIRFNCNSMHVIGMMLERSAGIGPLPKFVAETAVQQNRLVRLLPDWWIRAGTITLIWPSSRHLAPRVRAFLELTKQRLNVGHWMCIE